jgi:Ni2+-binding GTPase involved in maturation of urease and hydrogenase
MTINFEFDELKRILKGQNASILVIDKGANIKYVDKKLKNYFSDEKSLNGKINVGKFFGLKTKTVRF